MWLTGEARSAAGAGLLPRAPPAAEVAMFEGAILKFEGAMRKSRLSNTTQAAGHVYGPAQP